MKKRIIHIQLLPSIAGAQKVCLDEIKGLNDKCDFSVVCNSHGPLTEELGKLGVTVHIVKSLRREISLLYDFISLFSLLKIFLIGKYDIVHTHSSKTGVIGRIAARLSGCKNIIHTVHGFAFPAATTKISYFIYFFMEWIAKYCTSCLIVLNNSDRVISVSKLGYDSSKVIVLPNGVDLDEYSSDYFDQFQQKSDTFNIVMVGRLCEQKDPITFIRAAILLARKYKDIMFFIAGDGILYEKLKSLIDAEGVANRISLLGWQRDIKQTLVKSSVFVLPSKWEGMPLSILEAKASFLPCIVSKIAGNQDLVRHNIDGFVFDVGDYKALCNYIEYYYTKRDVFEDHSRESRKCVEEFFDIKNRHCSMIKIYNK